MSTDFQKFLKIFFENFFESIFEKFQCPLHAVVTVNVLIKEY